MGQREREALAIGDLRKFLALVEHRQFHKAAAELKLSRPALSQALVRLERSLGTRLATRRRGRPARDGMLLTEAGEELRVRASRILRDVDEAELAVRSQGRAPRRYVSIAHTPTHRGPVAAAVATLLREEPEIYISLTEIDDFEAIESGIQTGEFHLGFSPTFYFDKDNLEYWRFDPAPLRLFVGQGHPLATAVRVGNIADLSGERFVRLRSKSVEGSVAGYFERTRFVPKYAAETNNMDTVLALVRMSKLLAVLPMPRPRPPELQGLVVFDLPGPPSEHTIVAWRGSLPRETALQAVRALHELLGVSEPVRPTDSVLAKSLRLNFKPEE